MKETIQIFNDPSELAAAFANKLSKAILTKQIFHIALSGGSTPKLLFELLAEKYKHLVDWSKVHLWWGDERCVLPTDDQSNFRMTKKTLIDKIDIPSQNIHRIKGELIPEDARKEYSAELKLILPSREGLPVFDFVILGLGTDGHTASIFPNNLYTNSNQICEIATQPETGQNRITLNPKVINQADHIHFLVSGNSKGEVIKNLLEGNPISDKYPASLIRNAIWWLDKDAYALSNDDQLSNNKGCLF